MPQFMGRLSADKCGYTDIGLPAKASLDLIALLSQLYAFIMLLKVAEV